MNTGIKERKRVDIIMAAAEEFQANGYDRAKVENIAVRASVGKSTVYEYFNSKSHIFEEMASLFLKEYIAKDNDIFVSDDTLKHKLGRFFRMNSSLLSKKHANVLISPRDMHMPERAFEEMNKLQKNIFECLVTQFDRAKERREVNENLNSSCAAHCVMGVVLQICSASIYSVARRDETSSLSVFSSDTYIEELIETLFYGFSRTPNQKDSASD